MNGLGIERALSCTSRMGRIWVGRAEPTEQHKPDMKGEYMGCIEDVARSLPSARESSDMILGSNWRIFNGRLWYQTPLIRGADRFRKKANTDSGHQLSVIVS